jgi:hypothetical protein
MKICKTDEASDLNLMKISENVESFYLVQNVILCVEKKKMIPNLKYLLIIV